MTNGSDRQKFEALYDEHARLVRSVLHRMVIDENSLDDLVQETFVRVWRALPKFAARSSIKTWVYRIAVNVAIDHFRVRTTRKEEPLVIEFEATSGGESIEIEKRGLLIRHAMADLDEAHRSVITLHYFEGLEIKDVAEVLEIPIGTVKSRLYSGREKLKGLLKQRGVYDEQW